MATTLRPPTRAALATVATHGICRGRGETVEWHTYHCLPVARLVDELLDHSPSDRFAAYVEDQAAAARRDAKASVSWRLINPRALLAWLQLRLLAREFTDQASLHRIRHAAVTTLRAAPRRAVDITIDDLDRLPQLMKIRAVLMRHAPLEVRGAQITCDCGVVVSAISPARGDLASAMALHETGRLVAEFPDLLRAVPA